MKVRIPFEDLERYALKGLYQEQPQLFKGATITSFKFLKEYDLEVGEYDLPDLIEIDILTSNEKEDE